MFRPLIHFFGAAIVFYAILTNDTFTWFGVFHNLRILTLWNLWILFFFFLASIFYDLVLSVKKSTHRFFRETLSDCFNAIVFPLSLFVQIVFLGVFLLDGDVPFGWFTDLHNQLSHTLPALLVILERCLTYHPYLNVRCHMISLVLLTFLYQLTVMLLRTARGSWIYLFLDSFKLNSRMMFFLAMLPILCIIYFIGSQFNHRLWRTTKRRRASNECN